MPGLGSFLFGGNADAPEYKNPGMNPETQQAIGNVERQAGRSNEDLEKTLMDGVAGTGQGLLQSQEQIGQGESALGMLSSDSQRQALANRNQRIYNEDLNTMQRAVPQAAAEWHQQRMAQAQKIMNARDEWNMNVAGAEIQSVLNQRAARNAVIGDILGIVGVAAGAYFGGAAGAGGGGAAGGTGGSAAGSGGGAGGASVAGGPKLTAYDYARMGGRMGAGGNGGMDVNRDYSGR